MLEQLVDLLGDQDSRVVVDLGGEGVVACSIGGVPGQEELFFGDWLTAHVIDDGEGQGDLD